MIKRTELNRLVVLTLEFHKEGLSARSLYNIFTEEYPSVLKRERVDGFKSFTMILPSLNVKKVGTRNKIKYVKLERF